METLSSQFEDLDVAVSSACSEPLAHPLKPMPSVPHKASRTFKELIEDVDMALSGEQTEIETVKEILASYKAHPKDFNKYLHFDPTKYTRNLVSDGNGKYNLLILCWNLGQASPIHDHANSHCFVKVLGGELTETLYPPPCEVQDCEEMKPTSVATAQVNDVCYIDDTIGLHRMSNNSHMDVAISLHLYSPPYTECHIFDPRNSKKTMAAPMVFYSRGGVKQ